MRHLQKRDKQGALTLVDIQTQEFAAQYPELDWHALNARIHGLLPDGTLITGLDVTHQAWKAVGVGWLYAPCAGLVFVLLPIGVTSNSLNTVIPFRIY